jgi:hypothetical protein
MESDLTKDTEPEQLAMEDVCHKGRSRSFVLEKRQKRKLWKAGLANDPEGKWEEQQRLFAEAEARQQ